MSSKIFLKSKTNEFLSNKHNAEALRSIIDSFKVSKSDYERWKTWVLFSPITFLRNQRKNSRQSHLICSFSKQSLLIFWNLSIWELKLFQCNWKVRKLTFSKSIMWQFCFVRRLTRECSQAVASRTLYRVIWVDRWMSWQWSTIWSSASSQHQHEVTDKWRILSNWGRA